jgi:PTH1 family peptidyl-tRNA hydrolase
MYLIAGLGNPERKYEDTRHNIGFKIIDRLIERENIGLKSSLKFKGVYGTFFWDNKKVAIVKPQTYMNLSGFCIRKIAEFYDIDDEKILVVTDDVNLPFQTFRIRKKGGAGGHNGLKSIIQNLGTQEFPRIRVGVSGPANSNIDLADYVLGQFNSYEKKELPVIIDEVIEAIECIIQNGLDNAMNKFNKKTKKT